MENVVAPPRRKKTTPQDSVGLLMSLVRSLSQSENMKEREDIKRELERNFKECDQNMDKLIQTHHEDLTSLIQAFSKIYTRITVSREKIKNIKEMLHSCKSLLHCKRDELKKLYIEGVEQKQVLVLLEQIDQVKEVPQRLHAYMSKKHYLHASEELVSALARLEEDLSEVDGLHDLRLELQDKKAKLHRELVEELHKHLYIRSTSDIVRSFRRQGSARYGQHGLAAVKATGVSASILGSALGTPSRLDVSGLGRPSMPTHRRSHSRSRALEVPSPPPAADRNTSAICEDLHEMNPEENSGHFMAILVESLNVLGKLPDAVEEIQERVEAESFAIVRRGAQHVLDCAYLRDGGAPTSPRLLLALLELVSAEFRCVSSAHTSLLGSVRRVAATTTPGAGARAEPQLYTMAEVWSKIQSVLQEVLREYLDMERSSTTHRAPAQFADPSNNVDIAAHFARKRAPASARGRRTLFRFEASSHAISMTSFLREQRQGLYGAPGDDDPPPASPAAATAAAAAEGRHELVCAPAARNVTVVFTPLLRFVREVEDGIGGTCTLREFLTDYVTKVFMGEVQCDMAHRAESATCIRDAMKAVNTDHETLKTLNLQRPVLQSAITIHQCVEELRQLAQDLPLYAEQFLTMIVTILKDYKEICQASYRDIVQPDSEEKRVISANWAKDEDLNRFLRSLPNWQNLLQQHDCRAADQEESQEEVRARNVRESEKLIEMVGDGTLRQHDILADPAQLRVLAHLQETLSWLAERTYYLATCLPTVSMQTSSLSDNVMDIPQVAEGIIQSLIAISREFEELSELCLLVLHLEVRVHCFYYLIPLAHEDNFFCHADDVDTDVAVLRLNRDVSAIEEAMSASLQTGKFRYIFEGLGHLIASILINSSEYIKRINENGIKKMCRDVFAIQQNLNNITMQRESDLIQARFYYEMLYSRPETILENVMEQGPRFSELEYINALSLLHRSQPASDERDFKQRLFKLREIINDTVRV